MYFNQSIKVPAYFHIEGLPIVPYKMEVHLGRMGLHTVENARVLGSQRRGAYRDLLSLVEDDQEELAEPEDL